MLWLGLAVLLVLVCFGFVLLFGAPYLPTLSKQVETALELADLEPNEMLLELGCGDGKVLAAAARRGWRAIGYELNPLLVLVCRLRTRRYKDRVQVRWGNFLTQKWPAADAIFIFGLPRIMPQVDKKIVKSIIHPTKLISFAFPVPGREVVRQRNGIYLYQYDPEKRLLETAA